MWPPFNKQRTSGVKLQGSEGMEIYIFHYYVSGSIRSQLMNIFSCRSLHIKILCLSPNETKPCRGQLHLAYSFARFKSKICQFRKTDGYEFHRITKRFLFCTKMPDAIPWTCLFLKDVICCFRIRKVNWVGPVTVFFLLYFIFLTFSVWKCYASFKDKLKYLLCWDLFQYYPATSRTFSAFLIWKVYLKILTEDNHLLMISM